MLKKSVTFCATVAVLAAAVMPTEAVVIFSDDFESYQNNAQLTALGAWGDNNNASIITSTTLSNSGNPGKALAVSVASGALFSAQHNFAPNITPTDALPIVWSFDFFDDGVGNKRVTGGLRSQNASSILEMGRYNNANNGAAAISGYAVRTALIGGPVAVPGDAGWFSFVGNPTISTGWHRFTAHVRASDVLFEFDRNADGIVDANRVLATTTGGTEIYNVLRLGGPSDVSSPGGGARFDDVFLGRFETTKGVFSTGVGGLGNLLLADAIDQHWTVQRVAAADSAVSLTQGSPTFVVPADGFPIPPWVANSSTSKWIAPTQEDDANDAPGFYDYSLDFVLSPSETSYLILGNWAADNRGLDIFLNGTSTGQSVAGFTALANFEVREGFVQGLNRLTFRVQNDGTANNPTGLRVNITSAGAIPEPGTITLGALALAALVGRRPSRTRKA